MKSIKSTLFCILSKTFRRGERAYRYESRLSKPCQKHRDLVWRRWHSKKPNRINQVQSINQPHVSLLPLGCFHTPARTTRLIPNTFQSPRTFISRQRHLYRLRRDVGRPWCSRSRCSILAGQILQRILARLSSSRGLLRVFRLVWEIPMV